MTNLNYFSKMHTFNKVSNVIAVNTNSHAVYLEIQINFSDHFTHLQNEK